MEALLKEFKKKHLTKEKTKKNMDFNRLRFESTPQQAIEEYLREKLKKAV